MISFFIFGEDLFPDSGEIDEFEVEEVFSQPADDLHLAVGAVVEELEDCHLVFDVVKNYAKVYLPFAYYACGEEDSATEKLAVVNC